MYTSPQRVRSPQISVRKKSPHQQRCASRRIHIGKKGGLYYNTQSGRRYCSPELVNPAFHQEDSSSSSNPLTAVERKIAQEESSPPVTLPPDLLKVARSRVNE